MPEIDKSYLAGLFLDEITLDVMPQAYIDAALEVKLRYDACAPRAGYNCVQDRRVKGGFYYRKAPKGQGVNALPPSRLERAMARSQEESKPRSEMGFLSKAAIGTGVAIGGLALTGAVVNAGRSSEPYQEPVRQRPSQPSQNNTVRNVGVGVGAAATVGLGVGAAIVNRNTQPVNTDIKEVEPIVQKVESTPATKPQRSQEVRTPEEQAGFDAQSAKNKALSEELSRVGYLIQKGGYEGALRKQLKAKGELPDDIERKVKSLEFEGEDEGFVRIEDVRAQMGGRITKNVRDRQSQKLQELYTKLKEFGLEDAIEFRGARNKGSGTPAPSADRYSIDLGEGSVQVGEIRFKKTQAQLQEAIAKKLKPQAEQSQPTEKSTKPVSTLPKPADLSKNPEWVRESIADTVKTVSQSDQEKIVALSQTKTAREVAADLGMYTEINGSKIADTEKIRAVRTFYGVGSLDDDDRASDGMPAKALSAPQTTKGGAIAYLGVNINNLGRTSEDGYVNQAAILKNGVLRKQLGDYAATDLIAEGLSEGRIQQKAVGGNTYIRDISAMPIDSFISEAKGLTDVRDTKKDPRIKDLNAVVEYKLANANESDKSKIAELQAAIAGVQEVKPSDRGGSKKLPVAPKPDGESGVEVGKEEKPEPEKARVKRVQNIGSYKELDALSPKDLEVYMAKSTDKQRLELKGKLDADRKILSELPETPSVKAALEKADDYDLVLFASIPDPKEKPVKVVSPKREGDIKDRKKSPEEGVISIGQKLLERQAQGESVAQLNKEILSLRKTPFVIEKLKAEQESIKKEYEAKISAATDEKKVQLEEEKKNSLTAKSLEVFRSFGIPDIFPSPVKTPAPTPEPTPPPSAPPAAPASGAASENVASQEPAPKAPASKEKKSRASRKPAQPVNTVSSTTSKAESIDLKTLQSNINATKNAVAKLEKSLTRMQAGGDPYKSAIDIMGTKQEELDTITREKLISKLEKEIAKNKERVAEMEKEGLDYVKSLTNNNDAIAPSESYHRAYWETRNKYRRVG